MFRHLKPEARAEVVQEVVCTALQAFGRLVQLGKTSIAYAAPLAAYGYKQAHDGRKVGDHLNCLDVPSSYCQRLKGIFLDRLDQFDQEENAWIEDSSKIVGPAPMKSPAPASTSLTGWLR